MQINSHAWMRQAASMHPRSKCIDWFGLRNVDIYHRLHEWFHAVEMIFIALMVGGLVRSWEIHALLTPADVDGKSPADQAVLSSWIYHGLMGQQHQWWFGASWLVLVGLIDRFLWQSIEWSIN